MRPASAIFQNFPIKPADGAVIEFKLNEKQKCMTREIIRR